MRTLQEHYEERIESFATIAAGRFELRRTVRVTRRAQENELDLVSSPPPICCCRGGDHRHWSSGRFGRTRRPRRAQAGAGGREPVPEQGAGLPPQPLAE